MRGEGGRKKIKENHKNYKKKIIHITQNFLHICICICHMQEGSLV